MPAGPAFDIVRSTPHGDAQAVSRAMRHRLPRAAPVVRPTSCWRWSRPESWLRTRSWRRRVGGTPARSLGTSVSVMPRGTTSTPPWTGCSSDNRPSRRTRGSPPRCRQPGVVRPDLQLFRGHNLFTGQARLQPRRQEGQAAGQLRPVDRWPRLPDLRVGATATRMTPRRCYLRCARSTTNSALAPSS